ncbi:cyclic nucleotide-gated ion channel 1 isoform X2 [Aegilops tauschii subsp. strangulata]|uniref:cyclic nucleotide-gated ion channel 1 isoform X2 n=1 Tax=Aegilops tauschii subsp. strangulata TaxID=200361 RepID=UPI001ABC38C9|nr:cyclic nucleotide-gated ion channel 1 isoform X2 [Aegilops tauschii subsp. strangulata]
MAFREERYVRFHDWRSEYSVGSDKIVSEGRHTAFDSLKDKTLGAFSFLGNSSHPETLNKSTPEERKAKTRVLDPQGPFLQRWNKIFVISCLIAVSVDPLFFYIPVIDGVKNCLYLDKKLATIASILRFFTDIFYLLHIIFQFRTGFVAPSRVFGRGVLVEDTFAIAKRYLTTYFLIDFLAVMPLPQVFVLLVLPHLKDSKVMEAKDILMVIVTCQYVPRLVRIIPLYLQITRSAGIITETAWAGAAFNLLIYMLASHVFGALWYLLSIQREDTCWRKECGKINCNFASLYCGSNTARDTIFLQNVCLTNGSDDIDPTFGIYLPALRTVSQSTSFFEKFFYCFWWGLQSLSSLGQNLKTSTYTWENLFAVFVSISGLVLFALLIGNVQVPMFENMDEQLLDAMCDRLKPMLYTEDSCIIREGDPVNEMLFVMRGYLESMTTNGGQSGFFNSNVLKGGDFCGEELLTWALDPAAVSNLPSSTRTVKTLSEVEAFVLRADDLKFVATQFRKLHSKQLQHTFRFYSQQWRTWAACFIQAAWHRYCRKKLEDSLFEKEKRLQAAIVSDDSTKLSLGAALYASRFAGNMMRILRRNATRKARLQERVPARLLQKPAEPNFFAVGE